MSNDEIYECAFERIQNVCMDLAYSVRKRKKYTVEVIPKNKWVSAVNELANYNKLLRTREQDVLEWKEIVLNNIFLLEYINSLWGYSSQFDTYDFHDVWLTEDDDIPKDWSDVMRIVDEKGWEEFIPTWNNGHYLVSDYGLPQLIKLAHELIPEKNPEAICYLIDRVLQVTHPRSDMAELFIEDGSKTLDYIFEKQTA